MSLFNMCSCSTSESLESPHLLKQRHKTQPPQSINKPKKIHDASLQIQEVAPQALAKPPTPRRQSRLRPVIVDPHSIKLAGLVRTACESNIQAQSLPRQTNYRREEALHDLKKDRELHELTKNAYSFCLKMTENFVVEGKLDVSLVDITHEMPDFKENDGWESFQQLVGRTDRNQFLWLLRVHKDSLNWFKKLPTVLIEEIIYSLDLESALNARLVDRRVSDVIMFKEESTLLRGFLLRCFKTNNIPEKKYIDFFAQSQEAGKGGNSRSKRVATFFVGIRKLFVEPHARVHLMQIIQANLSGHRELASRLLNLYEAETHRFVIFRELKDYNEYLQEKVGEENMETFQWSSHDVTLVGIFLCWMNRFDLMKRILKMIAPLEFKEQKEFISDMLVDMTVFSPEFTIAEYWRMFLRDDEFPGSEYLYQRFHECARYSEQVRIALETNFSVQVAPSHSRENDYQERERRVVWLGHCLLCDWSKYRWSDDEGLLREVCRCAREEKWVELVKTVLER